LQATGDFMVGYDAFGSLDLKNFRWSMAMYKLCDSGEVTIGRAAFCPSAQHASPLALAPWALGPGVGPDTFFTRTREPRRRPPLAAVPEGTGEEPAEPGGGVDDPLLYEPTSPASDQEDLPDDSEDMGGAEVDEGLAESIVGDMDAADVAEADLGADGLEPQGCRKDDACFC
jgi:hypothetical protein